MSPIILCPFGADEADGEVAVEGGHEEALLEDLGGQSLRPLRRPHEPTPEEVDEHNVHHANYRAWCPHCVAGKGKAEAHIRLQSEREHVIPSLSMDYTFMGNEKG